MKQVVPADRSHRRFNKWHGNLGERSRSACGCRFDCPAQRSQPRRRRSCGCSRGRKNPHRRRKAPISFALKFDPSKATAEIPFLPASQGMASSFLFRLRLLRFPISPIPPRFILLYREQLQKRVTRRLLLFPKLRRTSRTDLVRYWPIRGRPLPV